MKASQIKDEGIKTLTFKLNQLIEQRAKSNKLIRRKDKGFRDWLITSRDKITIRIKSLRKSIKILEDAQR